MKSTRQVASHHGDGVGEDGPGLPAEVREWLTRRSSRASAWPLELLMAVKGTSRLSVVIPARDEEATVGAIVSVIRRFLIERTPLIDELIVVDSQSRDATAAVAAAAGATVIAQEEVLGHLPPLQGKGEALWKGLAASTGDIVAFIDADLRSFASAFVTGLLGPLLTDPTVSYVKGFYHRPLAYASITVPDAGGRVTELVARPLLNLHWSRLAGFVQPLAGEFAGRREILERIPFVSGYGVEFGLLVDLLDLVGLDALAQVDLGRRQHRNQSTEALGRMAGQIMLTAFSRLERQGRILAAEAPASLLAQFRRGDSGDGLEREVLVSDLAVPERPPLVSLRHEKAEADLVSDTSRA
ncbi:MAG: glucosyl-3-phosphoglycerate synthase [Nitriliruptorales bacterium]